MDPTYPTNPVTGGPAYAGPSYVDPVTGPHYREEPLVPPSTGTWQDRVDYPRYAFYGGMAGGVLILLAAFLGALLLTAMATFGGGLPSWAWGVDDDPGGRDDGFPEVPILIGVWGLVTGGAVLLAALRVKERPQHAAMPGILMIAAGVLSFFALGGFMLGGLLAIVAGVLAVAGSRSVWYARGPRLRERDYAAR